VIETGRDSLFAALKSATLPGLLRTLTQSFGPEEFGIEALLPTGRALVSEWVLGEPLRQFTQHILQVFEQNEPVLRLLRDAGLEFPEELRDVAEFSLGRRFDLEVERAQGSWDPRDYERAQAIADEAHRLGVPLDLRHAGRTLSGLVSQAVAEAVSAGTPDAIAMARSLAELLTRLGAPKFFERAQELLSDALSVHGERSEAMRDLAHALGFASRP
jgi:hypothetical protein